MASLLATLAFLAGCDRAVDAIGAFFDRAPEEAPAPPAKAETAGPQTTVDLDRIDRSVSPGEDFFAFAVGRRTGGGQASAFDVAGDRAAAAALDTLRRMSAEDPAAETAAAAVLAAIERHADIDALDSAGLAPALTALAPILAAETNGDIARIMADPGLAPTTPFAPYVAFAAYAESVNADRPMLHLTQSGLGLGEREAYLDPGRVADLNAYRTHVAALLALAGRDAPERRAAAVLAFETKLAEAHWNSSKTRSFDLTNRIVAAADLAATAPGFPWAVHLEAAGVGASGFVVLREDTAIAGMAKAFAQTPMDHLRDYLAFHFLNAYSDAGPSELRTARARAGLAGDEDPARRALSALDIYRDAVVDAAGAPIDEAIAGPEARAAAAAIAWDLRAAVEDRILAAKGWSRTAQETALNKLAALSVEIGAPPAVAPAGSAFTGAQSSIEDRIAVNRWRWRRAIAHLGSGAMGEPAWRPAPWEPNAAYDPATNRVMVGAALLAPPFLDAAGDPAANHGALGAIIGHEIAHAFDDEGRRIDADGELRDWWTAADADRRAATHQLLAATIAESAGDPIGGGLSPSEALADAAGLAAAHDALRVREGVAASIGGLSADQRFFLAWAQLWGDDATASARLRAETAPRHLAAWREAFDVEAGEALYLEPGARIPEPW